jgi:hypothetical protein
VYAGTSVVTPLVTATTLGGTLSTAAQTNITSVGTLSALTVTGAATAGKLVPTANTVAGNGMYLPTTNTLAFSTDGAQRMLVNAPTPGQSTVTITSPNTDSFTGLSLTGQLAGWNDIRISNTSGGMWMGVLRDDGVAPFTSTAYAGYIGTNVNQPLVFTTNSTERARITAGGDFLVGTTTSRGKATVEGDGGVFGLLNTNATAGSGDRFHLVFYENGTERGSITSNGSVTAYNTSSDRRFKENIVPAGEAGDLIAAINIVAFDWKSGGHSRFGIIAQDEVDNIREAVLVGDGEDEVQRSWGVDYSKLVPIIIKALQESQARIESLEARLDALEN